MEKDFFSSKYTLYSNNETIGGLNDKSFSQTAFGEFRSKKYIFISKGFLTLRTAIIDKEKDERIGEITYNNWYSKATITVNNKMFNWKYENIWITKWRIFNSEKINIEYAGSSSRGEIETGIHDPLLILTGLFVANYFRQMTVALLIAVFIPVWLTIFS